LIKVFRYTERSTMSSSGLESRDNVSRDDPTSSTLATVSHPPQTVATNGDLTVAQREPPQEATSLHAPTIDEPLSWRQKSLLTCGDYYFPKASKRETDVSRWRRRKRIRNSYYS
jgi:hypothetical protein